MKILLVCCDFLSVSFLGAESTLQMDEMQFFRLRLLDSNPLEP